MCPRNDGLYMPKYVRMFGTHLYVVSNSYHDDDSGSSDDAVAVYQFNASAGGRLTFIESHERLTGYSQREFDSLLPFLPHKHLVS